MTQKTEKEIIRSVLDQFPQDSLLTSFGKVYLKSVSLRALQQHSIANLGTFIQNRFEYFKASVKAGNDFRIYSPSASEKVHESQVLEIVCPDAPYLIETIETLLTSKGYDIVKLYHPIIYTQLDSNRSVVSLENTKENTSLYSVIFVEFQLKEGKKHTELLKKELATKLVALQRSFQDQDAIFSKLSEVQNKVKQLPNSSHVFHSEWVDLFDWLKNNNFSFFGYSEFELNSTQNKVTVKQKEESGLGILSPDYVAIDGSCNATLEKHVTDFNQYRSLFLFDTLNFPSPIKQQSNLMRLSLKIPSNSHTIEHTFLGLMRRSTLHVKNLDTPIIRRKIQTIFEEKNMFENSYDYNQIIRFFTVTPKFELFRTPNKLLLQMAEDLLSITNPNEIYVFTREKVIPSRLFLMVVFPAHLETTETIEKIITYMAKSIPHSSFEHVKSSGEQLSRLHFYFTQSSKQDWSPDCRKLEQELREKIKPWSEQVMEEITKKSPKTTAQRLKKKYLHAFPNAYRVMRTAKEAVRDIDYLESIQGPNDILFCLVPFSFSDSVISQKASILIVYHKEKVDLTSIMPILQNLKIHVYDEVTSRIGPQTDTIGYIHSFRIAKQSLDRIDESQSRHNLVEALLAIFDGRTSNDSLNGLVLEAGLSYRAINILQTYRNYLTQVDSTYSHEKVSSVLLKHHDMARLLIDYFESKFSPTLAFSSLAKRKSNLKQLAKTFSEKLTAIQDIAEDFILRHLFLIMEHTLRTNYFIQKENNDAFISIKIDAENLKLTTPAPYREIFVYDVEMEGCHIRFGPVSRGGLRWSDRLFDYRKEILGLVNTQQTKNVVIVPVGSKGGFVVKKHSPNRAEEAKTQYKKFIKGLLDITDSLDNTNQVIPAKQVIAYDKPDPYLVVAADKGTAQFSDIANNLSNEYNFWLDDAFASGGTNGYNHKEVGITAKGAWECVTLHFKELGTDIYKTPFTVVGIGDMAGDVFGNGMLLSKKIRLVAAFNHIHIFFDPNPNEEKSWKERHRLFHSKNASWKDYDRRLISKGGGIFNRQAKEIELSTEMRTALKIKKKTVSGEELIHFILKQKVDLLWCGGIGTYIKSDRETHAQVNDHTNDAVRINHSESAFRVIGEGANLCLTSSARMALSAKGIKINTDYIDNSAGVNMSDYEVNIKIFLHYLIVNKLLTTGTERNMLLKRATDEITELVLVNNRSQHRLLSLDELRSAENSRPFQKLIQDLAARKIITIQDHNEFSPITLEPIIRSQKAFPRPLLANIQAQVKMELFNTLMSSDLLQSHELGDMYLAYFPKELKKKYANQIMYHPLKKEILNTLITNKVVNQAGSTFLYEMQSLTGKNLETICRYYLTLELGLNASEIREKILSAPVSTQHQYMAMNDYETHLRSEILHLLQFPFELNLEHIHDIQELFTLLKKTFSKFSTSQSSQIKRWEAMGFSETLSKELYFVQFTEHINNLIFLNESHNNNPSDLLTLLIELDSLFDFKWIKQKIKDLKIASQWEHQQVETLLLSLRIQNLSIVKHLIEKHASQEIASLTTSQLKASITADFPASTHYFNTLSQLKQSTKPSLTNISVVINRLNLLKEHL